MRTNNRREFLGKAGALGLGALLPFAKKASAAPDSCTLLPSETRGPFPLFNQTAITSQTALIRSNIKETQTGVPLNLSITVQNQDCTPVANAKVYIWHCSKAGLYSGYSNGMNPGQAGLTYLRGIQISDAGGKVDFDTIFPAWYNGRLTHIHVEVYINEVLMLTSQFAFPLDSVAGTPTQLVNASYGKANNSITSYSGDNVFSDGYSSQLLTLDGNVSAGYTASHTFTLSYVVTPLRLISFTGGVENKNPMLWWATENETNVNRFDIEQSTHPSKNYEVVGNVKAFNRTSVNNYSFALQSPLPADMTYYRLKMLDTDGRAQYSSVVTIYADTVKKMYLVNSYSTGQLIVKHPSIYSNSLLKIITPSGQMIATGKLKTGVTETTINIANLQDGAYMLIIETGIDRLVTKFFKGH